MTIVTRVCPRIVLSVCMRESWVCMLLKVRHVTGLSIMHHSGLRTKLDCQTVQGEAAGC